MAEDISLGDKIILSGFSDEDGSTMIAVKKIVGNYVKKIMDDHEDFQNLSVKSKKVHSHPGKDGKPEGGKYELHINANLGKAYASEVVDYNLFVGLDKAFKKVMAEMD